MTYALMGDTQIVHYFMLRLHRMFLCGFKYLYNNEMNVVK